MNIRSTLWPLLLVGGLMAGVGCVCVDPFAPSAERVFAATFSGLLSDAHNLEAGGQVWQGHDLYLTFDATKEIQLRDPASFGVPGPSDFPIVEAHSGPCATLLRLPEEERSVLYRTNPSKGYENGSFVVRALRTGRYCFRSWSYR